MHNSYTRIMIMRGLRVAKLVKLLLYRNKATKVNAKFIHQDHRSNSQRMDG